MNLPNEIILHIFTYVQDFKDLIYLIIGLSNYDIYLYYKPIFSYVNKDNYDKPIIIFKELCKNGDLSSLIKLFKTFYISESDVNQNFKLVGNKKKTRMFTPKHNIAFKLAAKNGCLDVLKWLKETFNINKYDCNTACRFAATGGYLDIVKWLKLTYLDNEALDRITFQFAAANGHLDILKWLTDNYNITKSCITILNNSFNSAAINGHLDVLKWLTVTFDITKTDDIYFYQHARLHACIKGYMNVVKWLTVTFNITREDSEVFYQLYNHIYGYKGKNKDVVKWLTFNYNVKKSYNGLNFISAPKHGFLYKC